MEGMHSYLLSSKALLSVDCMQRSIEERTWALEYVTFDDITICLTLGRVP